MGVHTLRVSNKGDDLETYAPETLNGAKLLGMYAPGSPEWHSERSNGVGGSEVGTILGLNPYESAYALWAKKTGKIESKIKETWAIRFGKAFEDPILQLWAEEHPEYEVFTTGTYQDEEVEYLHANPDAIARHRETGELKIVEVKTGRNTWPEVPPAYTAQVLHYMGVMKIRSGVIVAVAGMTWNEYEVPFSQGMINVQREAIRQFWSCVVNDRRPEWDGSDSTYQVVRQENPEIELREVELGQLGKELIKAQLHAENATQGLTMLKSQVLHEMGKAKWGTVKIDNGESLRITSRQLRAGTPVLVINKEGKIWI